MEEVSPPSLTPLQLVYKKNTTSEPKHAILDQQKPVLAIRSSASPGLSTSEQPDASLNFTTPISSRVQNRSGNEFTLVLKYRFAAESPEQKELWLAKLATLGIQVCPPSTVLYPTLFLSNSLSSVHSISESAVKSHSNPPCAPRDSPPEIQPFADIVLCSSRLLLKRMVRMVRKRRKRKVNPSELPDDCEPTQSMPYWGVFHLLYHCIAMWRQKTLLKRRSDHLLQ